MRDKFLHLLVACHFFINIYSIPVIRNNRLVTDQRDNSTSDDNANLFTAYKFMEKFGYIETQEEAGKVYTPETLIPYIKQMQRFGNIPASGVIDQETIKLMQTPRCGNKDTVPGKGKRRTKRYVVAATGWEKRHITYQVINWSPQLWNKSNVQKELKRAFSTWEVYSKLRFQEVHHSDADIKIFFATHTHGDYYPFDGQGGVLAHAYYPYEFDDFGGDIHFDESENWFIKPKDSYSGLDFFTVAVHEIGHSLGLAHSGAHGSIMNPYYKGYEPNFALGYDDVLGMYELYIKRKLPEDDAILTEPTLSPSTPNYPKYTTTTSTTSPPTTTTTTSTTSTTITTTQKLTTKSVHSTSPFAPKEPQDDGSSKYFPTNGEKDDIPRPGEGPNDDTPNQGERAENDIPLPDEPVVDETDFPTVDISGEADYDSIDKGNGVTIETNSTQESTNEDESSTPSYDNNDANTEENGNEPEDRIKINYEGDSDTIEDHLRKINKWKPILPPLKPLDDPIADRDYFNEDDVDAVFTDFDRPHIGTGDSNDNKDLCTGHFDAVSLIRKEIFIFKGKYLWRFHSIGHLERGYPAPILNLFHILPRNLSHIDAAYQRSNDSRIIFFIDDKFYVTDGQHLLENSPRPITDYGIPKYVQKVDAALYFLKNGKMYFFSKSEYWRYDEDLDRIDEGYPRHIKYWNGLPGNLDAAVTSNNYQTYFFKRDGYYQFDSDRVEVAKGYPQDIKHWAGEC